MEFNNTLLIIDPSATMRLLLSRIAEKSGWAVHAVADLADADAALERQAFQMVATAVQLPSGDYRDVLLHARQRPEMAFTPIVLVTGDAIDAHSAAALPSGITEIFSKANLDHFHIYLESFSKVDTLAAPLQGAAALIIDDEVSVGRYVGEILSKMGMAVTNTQGTEDALACGPHQRFDLVVVDLVLRDGESGNQIIRQIRAPSSESRNAHIIAISGFHDATRRNEAFRAGADTFLPKPFSVQELQTHVLRQMRPATETGEGAGGERVGRFNLSQRERMICSLVMAGHPDKFIAKKLDISFWTVRAHIGRIFRKCGVGNRVELGSLLRDAAPGKNLPQSDGKANDAAEASARGGIIDWLSLASHVVDGLHHGVLVLDRHRAVVYVNPTFTQITGYAAGEVIGTPALPLIADRSIEERYDAIFAEVDQSGSWHGTLWSSRRNKDTFLASVAIRRMPTGMPLGAAYAVEFTDVTAGRPGLEEVSYNALHDPLTGLANRTLLRNRVDQELHRASRSKTALALLYINLDRFRHINAREGHSTGDLVLVEVASRIASLLRKSDTLAHIGGDEFVIMLPDLSSPKEATRVAAKLIENLTSPIQVNRESFALTASIGIACFPDDGQTFDTLLQGADTAMFQAKQAGGNGYRCHAPTDAIRKAGRKS